MEQYCMASLVGWRMCKRGIRETSSIVVVRRKKRKPHKTKQDPFEQQIWEDQEFYHVGIAVIIENIIVHKRQEQEVCERHIEQAQAKIT